MNASTIKTADSIALLCPTCALCCNGVLFADVRLQKGDDDARLAALGLPLKRRATLPRFSQPCACLNGKLCQIYAERPVRCRTFECRLLQRTGAGEITEAAALKSIQKAHRCADRVRNILRELGDHDESIPLSRRYQRMMRQAIDLSADEHQIDLRGQLMMVVADLVGELDRNFLR
ncbi:MAG TPA: YkgJ family cysteine cluster protein [Candidatus Limnocylindria bacterium]|nr:YkgJ family cysteine cluster protein [Candidatus Limnocylindria bacterium]